MILTPADLPLARAYCAVLLSKAVNDDHGRDELDPFYKIVTENRDGPTPLLRAKYSSCADLAHWMLRCLGVRADWLNRNDDDDAQRWRVGVNLNWLCPPPIGKCRPARSRLAVNIELGAGDVFVENNAHGGHVFCARSYDPIADLLVTAEYGQPGGLTKKRAGFRASFAKRPLSFLSLADALPFCSADLDVAPIEDWCNGDLIAAFRGEQPYVE